MTPRDKNGPTESGPRRHRRIPGIRFISSAGALIGGIGALIRFALEPEGQNAAWLLPCGIVLLALGLVSIPVFWWMERRRL